jgi:hypothetical protein
MPHVNPCFVTSLPDFIAAWKFSLRNRLAAKLSDGTFVANVAIALNGRIIVSLQTGLSMDFICWGLVLREAVQVLPPSRRSHREDAALNPTIRNWSDKQNRDDMDLSVKGAFYADGWMPDLCLL